MNEVVQFPRSWIVRDQRETNFKPSEDALQVHRRIEEKEFARRRCTGKSDCRCESCVAYDESSPL